MCTKVYWCIYRNDCAYRRRNESKKKMEKVLKTRTRDNIAMIAQIVTEVWSLNRLIGFFLAIFRVDFVVASLLFFFSSRSYQTKVYKSMISELPNTRGERYRPRTHDISMMNGSIYYYRDNKKYIYIYKSDPLPFCRTMIAQKELLH